MNLLRKHTSPFSKPAVILLSAFGILPWFSFKKNTLVYYRLSQIYSILILLSVFALPLCLNKLRGQGMQSQQSKTLMTIVGVLYEFGGFAIIIMSVLGSSFWKIYIWQALLCRMYSTEKMLINKSTSTNSSFVLGNTCIVSLFLIDYLDPANQLFIYFTDLALIRYFYFLIAYTIFNVSHSISHRYKRLKEIFPSKHDLDADVVSKLRRVKKNFEALNGLTQYFNELFGWTFLMLSFCCMAHLISFCAFFVADHMAWGDAQIEISKIVIAVNVGYLLVSLVWLTAIIFCCDSVVRETEELLTNCYRLEQSLPLLSKELEELESLKKLIKNNSPKLTAAGFFEIRRSTLLSLLSTTTTYFIVALQFNSL